MKTLLLLLAVACGGGTKAPVAKPAPPAIAQPDPACPAAGKVELPADGALRCRELPIQITFPPGTKLTRSNDRNLTLFNAELEHGVLALIVEPRTDSPSAGEISEMLDKVAKGIAGDAVLVKTEAPPLVGATASAQLTFTTPDGGAGVVRGYFGNHWLVALAVGGRLASTPVRPDAPAGKAFLASLALRPLPTGTVRHALAGGAYLDIPATAWSTGTLPRETGVRAEWLMLVPDRNLWIGVRELEPMDRCKKLLDAGDGLAVKVAELYSNAQVPLQHIARGTLGELSVYADATATDRNVLLSLVCTGKTVVQLSVVANQPIEKLRPTLDELGASLVGAK
ncbi:MAG: hypothetical protein ABI867_13580 [Kofleriaceae bacterium]